MALPTNAFSKCTPSFATTIARCGTVTQCEALPLEADEIDTVFGTFADGTSTFRIVQSIFDYEFEIKQCGVEQVGLADFLQANKVIKTMGFESVDNGRYMIQPFVLAKQTSPINNAYWTFTNGLACLVDGTPDAGGTYWRIDAASPTGIPLDTRWFLASERVFLSGLTDAGTQTFTTYAITSAAIVGDIIRVVLNPKQAGSYLAGAALTKPVTGYLERGTANVSDFESFCSEPPGINNTKLVPFWVETDRMAMCRSELYRQFRMRLKDNPAYQTFYDLDEVELNKQQAKEYERKHLNQVMWGTASDANQTIDAYRSLTSITIPAGTIVTSGAEIGECVGKKADMVGFFQQHVQCSRYVDLQGAQLNLPALFNSFYTMQRVRQNGGSKAANVFDVYTDQVTAKNIRTAMFAYYQNEAQGMLRMTLDIGSLMQPKKAPMGFFYWEFPLSFPAGVTMCLIADPAFDDRLSVASSMNIPNTGRWLWILDWTKNYVAQAASNKVVNTVGSLKDIAGFDAIISCTMKRPIKEITMYSRTSAAVSECPAGDLMISNFSGSIPEAVNNIAAGTYG